ncbi:MAG TPA: thermosome subunit alpha [Nitrososphaeraceae archaeon]
MKQIEKLFGDGVNYNKGDEARRYNLLAVKLIAEIVKTFLGPRGMAKMFTDILGETTITKHGATLLRKIDVEHPAAKVIIEASNAVDNEVGDGTTSVVILAAALIKKAEELLDIGISPGTISDGYLEALKLSLTILQNLSERKENSDKETMMALAYTCLISKLLSATKNEAKMAARLVVNAVSYVANFSNNTIDIDNIKIEEKSGNPSDIHLIEGIAIDKSIDNDAMPRMINNAKILLINEELEAKRTKIDAEICISLPSEIKSYSEKESQMLKMKIQKIIRSKANVVISSKGINLLAQYHLSKSGIISIRRVKENDMQWIEKSTGARIVEDIDAIFSSSKCLGYAQKVHEVNVGEDKMVLIEGCINPKSVTLMLRSNSKNTLDEYHRSFLRAIHVLKDFIAKPNVVVGGGSVEVAIAAGIRKKAHSVSGRKQIVLLKFSEALEEIPLTIARNAGLNEIDTLTKLRSKVMHLRNHQTSLYGIDAMERKVQDMLPRMILEPTVVKEQIIKSAVEIAKLLIRVDDVLMAKPAVYTHTHADGTQHSHTGGDKKHGHYFDKLGRQQRPIHHYY